MSHDPLDVYGVVQESEPQQRRTRALEFVHHANILKDPSRRQCDRDILLACADGRGAQSTRSLESPSALATDQVNTPTKPRPRREETGAGAD